MWFNYQYAVTLTADALTCPADLDKDDDVDGSDLVVFAYKIQDGLIGDVTGALTEFVPRYGQLQ